MSPTRWTVLTSTPKHTIALKDFARFAKAIASSEDPKIRLPKRIVALIENVVRLRKQATSFFLKLAKKQTSRTIDTANAGHQHFVAVLEEVLSILRSTDSAPAEETSDVSNLFEALSVEDPIVSEEQDPKATVTLKAGKARKPAEYELQSTADDNIFAIFSLFKDVDDVREYLQDMWKDYRDGKVDLMSAAVTTDTAITLLRHNAEDVVNSIPGYPNYPSMITTLNTYLDRFGGAGDDFPDWTCLQTADLLNSFADVLDSSSVPVMKPGHLGIYNPKQDRSQLAESEKYREDMIVLLELLPEFTKLSRTKMSVPGQDGLTTGLRLMMDANSMEVLPMYAIFATQILLDVHHVLREDAVQPFMDLQATGKRAIATIDDYFKQVRKIAQEWAQEDRIGKAIVKGVGNIRARPYHLLKNHPVLCGLLVFQLNVHLNDGGINLCNAWGTAVYPAHLYNAAKHSAELEEKRDDMDYLLSVHSPQRIFVGAPPTNPQEYLRRFLLALGTSASAFARNRRQGGPALIPASRAGPRGLKTTSPVKDIFRNRYLYQGQPVLTTPNIVAMLAVASKAERTSQPSIDIAEFSRKMLLQKQFATLQLLTAVREGVASEELHLKVNLQGDLVKYFGDEYIEDESQLPFIIGYVFEVVAGSDRVAQNLRVANNGSRMLGTASEVLAMFLDREGRGEGIMKVRALTDTVVHAYHDGAL